MKIIIKKKSFIKTFYENVIKNKLPNTENLFEEVTTEFKEILNAQPVPKEAKALDLGYGYGNYSLAMARRGFIVDAIDFIPKKYFTNRLQLEEQHKKIKVIREDLFFFEPKGDFDFVVAKDVLHYLPREKVESLLDRLVKITKSQGQHYISIFVDIKRQSDSGKIQVENEANLSSVTLLKWCNEIYKNWDVSIMFEIYKEKDRSGVEGKFYFIAKKVTIIAKKGSPLV
ncbi:MAG: class I SAM-dependent methyltransferase [Patescibacteria group bacterium]